ncbi:MAG: hypothetical protein UV38_C0001G0145 [candidate division TM6 bacterium GW2011_GWE2_42_60]|nr:MAG: hypothetical protein UV38_C0001G0145 [candidate division TM6 bacterium GW2011_GWE2_42_60]
MNQKTHHSLVYCFLMALLTLSTGCYKKPATENKITLSSTASTQQSGEEIAALKKIKEMNFDEAQRVLTYQKQRGKDQLVIALLEKLIALSPDHETMELFLRELADIRFKLNAFEEAEMLYEQYAMLYPGSKDIDLIEYRVIQSLAGQLPDARRDQTRRKALLEKTAAYLERFGDNNQYVDAIKKIVQKERLILFESEAQHAAFYLQKYVYSERLSTLVAAQKRLIFVHDKLLPSLADALSKEKYTHILDTLTAIKEPAFSSKTAEQKLELLQQATDLLLLAAEELTPDQDTSSFSNVFKRIF